MHTVIIKIIFLISILILTACGEVEEKKSDMTLLTSEHENQLPESELKPANSNKSKEVLDNLPKPLSTSNFNYDSLDIKDSTKALQVFKIEQTGNLLDIHVKHLGQKGKVHLIDSTCTRAGFFSCKRWESFLYEIKNDENNKKNKLTKLKNLKFDSDYIKKKFSEKSQTLIANALVRGYLNVNNSDGIEFLKLETLEDKTFIMSFEGVENGIKDFDLNEGYDGDWHFKNIRLDYSKEEIKYINEFVSYLKKFKLEELSLDSLKQIYTYSDYPQVHELIAANILIRKKSKNSIPALHDFNLNYKKHSKLVNESVERTFQLVNMKDSISGYEWFVTNYSNTNYAKSALEKIHNIMFDKAKKLNTIAAYNSFIFSYPTAKQVQQANKIAYDLEKNVYTNLGFLGFWDTDNKKEKKSRKYLIKAKQIERFPRDNDLRGSSRSGYLIVADRMYKLLQEEFDESDATLRHLESQEFKDFVSDFKSIMFDIKKTLERIDTNTERLSRYTQDMINVAKKGFSDAKADRALAAYHQQKKTEWDKLMHFKDKGYN